MAFELFTPPSSRDSASSRRERRARRERDEAAYALQQIADLSSPTAAADLAERLEFIHAIAKHELDRFRRR